MLESGKVDAVVCVQSDENDRFTPKPVSSQSRCACGAFHTSHVRCCCTPKPLHLIDGGRQTCQKSLTT